MAAEAMRQIALRRDYMAGAYSGGVGRPHPIESPGPKLLSTCCPRRMVPKDQPGPGPGLDFPEYSRRPTRRPFGSVIQFRFSDCSS